MQFILAFLLFFLGFRKSIGLGIVLFVSFPFSGSYYSFVTLYGIFLYDFFFIGLFLRFVMEFNGRVRNVINVFPALIIFFYAIISLPYSVIDGAFLRDFRPAILIFEVFLLYNFPLNWTQKQFINYSFFGLVISLIFGLFSIIFADSELRDASFSYSSLSTYYALIIFLFRDQLKVLITSNFQTKFRLILFFSFILILMSWNRTLLFGVLIFEILKNVRSVRKFISSIAFIGLGLSGLLLLSLEFGIDKMIQSFSIDFIFEQLSTRYSPSLPYLSNLNFKIVFFGNGFGTLFYIPWFEFWGNDPYFNFLDNTYLTFFVKYGILGLIAVFFILYNFSSMSNSFVLMFFFFIVFFTTSFPYQIASLGVYLGLYLINHLKQLNSIVTNFKQ